MQSRTAHGDISGSAAEKSGAHSGSAQRKHGRLASSRAWHAGSAT